METATEVPSSAGLPVYSAMTQVFAADRAIECNQKKLKGADQIRALAQVSLVLNAALAKSGIQADLICYLPKAPLSSSANLNHRGEPRSAPHDPASYRVCTPCAQPVYTV